MVKIILETARLKLIPFTKNDFDLLHQTFTNSFIRKYLWDNQIITEKQTRDILEKNEQYFQVNKWGLWQINLQTNNSYLGFVGLWYFFDEEQPQLIYGLLPEQTGLGYATEASQSMIDYAFSELNFPYLTASIDTSHLQSRKVCERLKMDYLEDEVIEGKPTTFFRIENLKLKKS